MILRFFLLAGTFFLASCVSIDRNNPDDPGSDNYLGREGEQRSSSSGAVSSSSSLGYVPSSSNNSVSSSSSVQSGVVYGTPVDYEGETYETVVIGTQTWFKHNLNYAAEGSKCYDNSTANCTKYGRLYDWATALQLSSVCNTSNCASRVGSAKGICPDGWHIPSEADWNVLISFARAADPNNNATILKATSGWSNSYYTGKPGNGTDKYGFAALPGGYVYSNAGYTSFSSEGERGDWLSSTEFGANTTYHLSIYASNTTTYFAEGEKSYAQSVRCLKDSQSSSSGAAQSSNSRYTLTCEIPEGSAGDAGVALNPPTEVTCNDNDEGTSTSIKSGYTWANAPVWTSPATGKYNNISVSVVSGNCGGQTAKCDGTLTIAAPDPVIYGGETYESVVIGTQIWMSRNLNYDIAGTSKCYEDEEANCEIYGKLYDWATAMALPSSCNSNKCASQVTAKHQGICPENWHIPSDADWDVLMKFINPACTSGSDNCTGAGNELKAKSGWDSNGNKSGNGEDTYGFAALPGGGGSNGNFVDIGKFGYWWTATEGSANTSAYRRSMSYGSENVFMTDTYKSMTGNYVFLSVRCLKN